MKRFIPVLLLALTLLACDVSSITSNLPGQSAPTATTVAKAQPTVPAPTQTPVIIVVTATPAPVQPTIAVQPTIGVRVATALPTVGVQPTTFPTLAPLPTIGVQPTAVPQATPVPASNVPVYDDFNNPAFTGKMDDARWTRQEFVGPCPGNKNATIETGQKDGAFVLNLPCRGPQYIVEVKPAQRKIVNAYEMRFKLGDINPNTSAKFWMQINGNSGGDNWATNCTLLVGGRAELDCGIAGEYGAPGVTIQNNQWYTLKMTMAPDSLEVAFFLDGKEIGRAKPRYAVLLSNFTPGFGVMNFSDVPFGPIYIDEVRLDAPR